MKPFTTLLSALLGLSLLGTSADARGDGNGKGANRGGGGASAKRSPATGSKIQRPASRPAAKPAARPATKPAAKPAARPAAKPATKPAAKPAIERPTTKPAARPESRPQTLPGTKPAAKPGLTRPDTKPGLTRPDNKPGLTRPDNKPGLTRPDNKPDGKPNLDRPNANKPSTLPGMVSYPDRGGNGNKFGNNSGNKTGNNNRVGNNNVNIQGGDKTFKGGDRNTIHVDQVNVNRRNTALNRPATLPANKRDWNSNQWGGNKGVWGNNVNIGNDVNVNINNNFKKNNNFAYRPNAWGAKPWWGAGNCHNWHHGHWGYGYNSAHWRRAWYFDNDDDFADGFMWGIAAWSLGNSIYKMGYQSYSNPYPAPPVQNTTVVYSQPLSVSAAAAPPGDEQVYATAEAKSTEALEKSRAAFKTGDYPGALKSVDEAIAATPDDVTLHEYRALVFFALGKYGDAAGVLNPVLASGPGWGWDTMIAFYDGSSTYDGQLRKLEAWVKGSPDQAEGHFLLGYHYLVCGHMEKAYEQFDKTATLQPADSIARQLRDLTRESLPVEDSADTAPPAPPAPVPSEKLVGKWVSDNGAQGKVTFAMAADGSFTWSYANGDQSSELKGTYGLDDKGLLVLSMDDSQMISEVTLPSDSEMQFVIIGGPEGDPGLSFKKG